MKKWTVTGHVTISVTTVVEAKSEAMARRIANTRQLSTVHVPSDADENSEWVSGEELDGEVSVVSVDEAP